MVVYVDYISIEINNLKRTEVLLITKLINMAIKMS